ncbi:MAG: MATE family efflux transporter [Calditrichaeota bacterium]|nr:MATE family efflux transporter [Calditrichota bacterium]
MNPVLLEGKIPATLTRLTLQMSVGILAMQVFNLVDTFFVGQLGTNQLAAMGFTFPVVMVINSIALGLGIGASSVISRAIGEGNQSGVRRFTTDALSLSLIIVTFFVVIGLFTIEPLFRSLGATGEVIRYIESYMRIWFLGMPFVVIPMVGNSAIRATGDTKTPSFIMVSAVLVNIILDPLLIFGYGPFPRLELAGAALATVISRGLTMVLSLWILYRREKMLTFAVPRVKEVVQSWGKILYIGLPAAATNLITPISMGVITRLVADYGAPAVAGFGVGSRIQMFSLAIIGSLSSVLTPFVGQNWGAKYYTRIKNGVKFSYLVSLIWGIFLFLLFLLAANPLAALFNRNPQVIAATDAYLKIVSIGFPALGILILTASIFNALNKPLPASLLMIARMFVLYIPLAYLGSNLVGLTGIFWAAVLSNFMAGTAAYFWIKKEMAGFGRKPRLN